MRISARAPGGGRVRGPASAPVVADHHPSKPVGALYSLRIYYPLKLPLASVKASLQCLWREIVGLCFE